MGSSRAVRRMAGIVLAVGLALWGTAPAAGAETGKTIFMLDWIAYGKHAPFYVSLDKGYFKEIGLNVEIVRGNGSGDSVKVLNAGKSDYSFADLGPAIIARSKGAKVKSVAMVHDKNLHVIYALKGSGIRTPKDLEGRTVGTVPNEATHALFPSLALLNGVDAAKVKFTTTSFAVKVPSLFGGKVDAVTSFASDLPNYTKAAKQQGKEVVSILFSDYGVDIYSNGVIVTEKRLREKPGEVKGFVRAILKGLAWSVEHPDEAVKIFVKHKGTVDPGLARAHWDIAVDHLVTADTQKTGIGYVLPEKVQRTIDLVAKAWPMERKPTVDEVATNDFIDVKLTPKKR